MPTKQDSYLATISLTKLVSISNYMFEITLTSDNSCLINLKNK